MCCIGLRGGKRGIKVTGQAMYGAARETAKKYDNARERQHVNVKPPVHDGRRRWYTSNQLLYHEAVAAYRQHARR